MTTGPEDAPTSGIRPGEGKIILDILTRLEDVERDNRRLRRFTTTMLVAVATVLGLGAALVFYSGRSGLPGAPATISARQYDLRGADGTVRGAWGIGKDGAVRLVLSDAAGRQRVRLSLFEDGSAGLSFADSSDRKLAVLGLLPDHTTNLALTDPAGTPRAVLGVSPNGSSNLVFADQSGATRANLGVDSRGLGTFTLADRRGSAPSSDFLDTLATERPETDTTAAPPSQPSRR